MHLIMKKATTLFAALLLVFVLKAQAPIQIVSPVYGVVNSQTLTLYIANGQEIQEDFDVYFTGTPAPMMKVRKEHDSLVGLSRAWFCTGLSCYGDAVTLSDAFAGSPGTILQTHFKQSLTVCDTNVVRYTAYSLTNPNDSAWVELVYYCVSGLAGVADGTAANTLSVSPNPASDLLQLSFTAFQQNGQLELFNQLGERVQTLPIAALSTSTTVDVTSLADGVYMLRLSTAEGLLAHKTVIVTH